MNSILIELTLVSPPESRSTNDGNRQIGVAIAALQWEKNGEEIAQIMKVTAWRDVDLFLDLQKGDRVLFGGSIRLNTVDKGAYKAKVAELNCDSFECIATGTGRPSTPKSSVDFSKRVEKKTPVAAIAPPVSSVDSEKFPDYDDIPF